MPAEEEVGTSRPSSPDQQDELKVLTVMPHCTMEHSVSTDEDA